jgi:hypothetical protein
MRRTAIALLFALTQFAALRALEPPEYLRATWGVLVESFLNPSLASNVATPSINFNFGAGLSMPLSPGSRWAFAPSGDIYYYNAEWFDGQALPTDETVSSAFVLGLMLNAPIVYTLPLSDTLSLSGGVGLAIDLRAAFTSDSSYYPENTKRMNIYFWEKGRFFTPSTSVHFEYKLNDRVGFGFAGRVLWPIYNLWTGEGYGFLDQGKYIVDLVIRYKLKSDAKPTPARESPVDSAPSTGAGN